MRRALQEPVPAPLSRQTIIIIAVCTAIGSLVLAAILYRTIRVCCCSSSAPLPPAQPLARERQSHAPPNSSSYLSPPLPIQAHPRLYNSSGSKISLLGKGGLTDSRPTSFAPTSESAIEDATHQAPLQTVDFPPLHVLRAYSSISIASKTTDSYSASPSASTSSAALPLPPNPPTAQPSPDATMSHDHNGRRTRSTSFFSAHGTVRSKSSRSAIRGVPHRSGVQIILPAPLAYEVYYNQASPDRRNVADKWIPTGRESTFQTPE